MTDSAIKENASGGSFGAGSIASRMDGGPERAGKARHSENVHRTNAPKDKAEEENYAKMREKIANAKKKSDDEKKKKKKSFKDFFIRRGTNESYDMMDVVSRFKNIDVESEDSAKNVVSYGVEDDQGNVMKVTVRADQAKEFEETLAKELADGQTNKINGTAMNDKSMAELLFNLRDQFEIISVSFPQIPTDVIYNADKTTKAPGDMSTGGMGAGQNSQFSLDDDMGGEDQGQGGQPPTDDMNPMGQGMEGDQGGESGDLGATQPPAQGANPQGEEDKPFDINSDSDFQNSETQGQALDSLVSGEKGQPGESNSPDMSEPEGMESLGGEPTEDSASTPASLLSSIIDMLKQQAEATKAKADADAEESRAKQAEWSAIASDNETRKQEKLARMELAMDQQKAKEKESKKIADVARFNVSQSKGGTGFNEGRSFLRDALMDSIPLKEFQSIDDPSALNKAKLQVQQQYKIQPNDDQDTKNFKIAMVRLLLQDLSLRINISKVQSDYQKGQAADAKNNPNNQQNPNQNQQNQQNQNGQQPNTNGQQNTNPSSQQPSGNQSNQNGANG